jgi:hypothetical protein
MTESRLYSNPTARTWHFEGTPNHARHSIKNFHRDCFPEYPSTSLVHLPSLAEDLGVAHVFLKDESSRFGLPAFKILGASWAICSVLSKRLNIDIEEIKSFDALKERLEGAGEGNLTLYTATDGELCLYTISEGLMCPDIRKSWSSRCTGCWKAGCWCEDFRARGSLASFARRNPG